jgi:glycerophosphoryl diester phosphodiesterase
MADAFELQGHRGARGLRPENTLPAVEAAIDVGASSVEVDLHLTADGVVVLSHEPRVTDPPFRSVAPDALSVENPAPTLRRLSLRQLRHFLADRNPDPRRFPDQRTEQAPVSFHFARQAGFDTHAVPTLGDLFGFVAAYAGEPGREAGKNDSQRERAARLLFDLELKRVPFWPETIADGYDGTRAGPLEDAVLAAIGEAGVVSRTTVRSFDHRCVRLLVDREPGLRGAVLMADTAPVDPVAVARAAGASVYCPHFAFVDADLVRRVHDGGVRIIPWTVNDPGHWQRLLEWGVDGLTTDYPDRLAQFLGGRSP